MHHLPDLISDLAVVLGTAAFVSLVFQRLKLPVVMGYLLAGLIVGPYSFPMPSIVQPDAIQTLASLGVIFVMFSIGLEFSFRRLLAMGSSPGITGLFEMGGQFALGYGIGWLLGWTRTEAVFLGSMIAISSTTVIVKAFDELKVKTRRFAEAVVGVLIVEDLAAILILVVLTSFAQGRGMTSVDLLWTGGKLLFVVTAALISGYLLVPPFMRYVGKRGGEEMLMLVSVALCLLLVVGAAKLHYSSALGAFIMGSIIAESSESHRVDHVIAPIRDLFAAVFFVSVGMLLDPRVILANWSEILVISAAVIFGKVIFATIGSLISGQTLRTSIQVGMSLAQIGEFSFIIASTGLALGVVNRKLLPIAVSVSVLTTLCTPIMIRMGHKFAVSLESRLPMRIRDFLGRYAARVQRAPADVRNHPWSFIRLALSTFKDEPKSVRAPKDLRRSLAPWDAHLVRIKIHPNSWIVGKTLAQAALRSTHGISVVVIQRGLRTLVAPASQEVVFPKDELLVLGTDEKIDPLRLQLERPPGLEDRYEGLEHYQMKSVLIEEGAPWAGHTLRELQIRESWGAMVVGIERNSRRLLNPGPEDQVLVGDLIWIVGETGRLEPAVVQGAAPPAPTEGTV